MIPRAKHTAAQCIVDVPDAATAVLVELARNHAKDRTLWPWAEDFATWSVEQSDGGRWAFLGSSTAHGGSVSQEGVESETSWDRTPLRPGGNRKVRVIVVAHGAPVDTHVTVTPLFERVGLVPVK